VHASGHNQAEICFLRRVAPRRYNPTTSTSTRSSSTYSTSADRYEQIAQPFEWKFTRQDLDRVLDKLDAPHATHQLAA
jgi:hypothetical protein